VSADGHNPPVTTPKLPAKTPIIGEVRPLERRWVDVAGAAAYTSLSRTAIFKAIRSGQIPAKKIGRRFVIDVRVLDDWLTGEYIRQ
jgi:excisionase family DNA binding protein